MLADFGDGLFVCINCGHRLSFLRPLPLLAGPTRERPSRAVKTHFRCGHPKDDENTLMRQAKNGKAYTRCRNCKNRLMRKLYLKRTSRL